MHMHGGRIVLRSPDRLDAEWSMYNKGQQTGANKFFLERVKGAARAR
jgi:hypothetical protein